MIIIGIIILNGRIITAKQSSTNTNIVEKEYTVKLLVAIGSDEENEDFYRPKSFAVDHDKIIYILDTKNSRVQCFKPDGGFLRSFGKYGKGPGELSKNAEVISIIDNQNICIYDYLYRNVNVYSQEGKYLNGWKISSKCIYNDLEMINGKYYLSNAYLVNDNMPIHVYDKNGNYENGIGDLIEPEKGLIKEIAKYPNVGNEDFLGRSDFSNIAVISKNNIIYSMRNPYRIAKYNIDGKKVGEIMGDIDYGNEKYFYFQDNDGVMLLRGRFPVPIIYQPIVLKDDSFIVPLSDRNRKWLYLDKYDKYCKYEIRYKMPMRSIIDEKNESLGKIYIDDENVMYCLIGSDEKNPQLRKYKIVYIH